MVISATSHRPIQVDFLTDCYRIFGTVMVPHTGLIAVLTDINSSLVEVHQAQRSWLHLPVGRADQLENARLMKGHVIAACVGKREHLGAWMPSYYSSLQEYRVQMTTSHYMLEGYLQWPGRFEFTMLMGDNVRDFFPLYRVVINDLQVSSTQYDSPAVLINRRYINLMSFAVAE